jgi:hypothetical protein
MSPISHQFPTLVTFQFIPVSNLLIWLFQTTVLMMDLGGKVMDIEKNNV